VLVVLRVSVLVSSATATLIAQTRLMKPTAVSAQCRCLTTLLSTYHDDDDDDDDDDDV